MKTLTRFCASTAWALIISATCFAQHYTQTNLVSNTAGVAPVTDPQLINPWGLSRASGSPWWVSDNGTGFSTLYNGAGAKQSLIVTIPPAEPAVFLFSTIDGTIAGWNPNVAVAQGAAPPSMHAVTVIKATDGSSFTGLTSAFIDGKRYLYAANFTLGRVDVYDNAFHAVTLSKEHFKQDASDQDGHSSENPFMDEQLPAHYVPFNVQAMGNDIVVTYVLHQEGEKLETDGPGLGFVDIFSSSGRLLQRLEHGDWLNAPWGVALAPLDFGRFSHDLLIGQFAGAGDTQSSGFIAAYDLATGKFDRVLQDASGKPLAINGIWALSPGNVSPNNSDVAA